MWACLHDCILSAGLDGFQSAGGAVKGSHKDLAHSIVQFLDPLYAGTSSPLGPKAGNDDGGSSRGTLPRLVHTQRLSVGLRSHSPACLKRWVYVVVVADVDSDDEDRDRPTQLPPEVWAQKRAGRKLRMLLKYIGEGAVVEN